MRVHPSKHDRTGGMVGFQINDKAPPGSVQHWATSGIFKAALTKSQFRSKARKHAVVAQAFIKNNNEIPPPELRPQFHPEEIQDIIEQGRDTRTIDEKLAVVTDLQELFMFFQYFDGYRTNGEIGFNPGSGPPGSINHKRSFTGIFKTMTESQFRDKGRLLASLAKEFVETGTEPPEDRRPVRIEQEIPWDIVEAALNAQY
jgi:hypothetical protein